MSSLSSISDRMQREMPDEQWHCSRRDGVIGVCEVRDVVFMVLPRCVSELGARVVPCRWVCVSSVAACAAQR